MHVVIARWTAREGEEREVERILRTVSTLTEEEPGCREFTVLRALDEPRSFLLYEIYDDAAAFQAHRESEHFKQHVLGDAIARLESRSAAAYEPFG